MLGCARHFVSPRRTFHALSPCCDEPAQPPEARVTERARFEVSEDSLERDRARSASRKRPRPASFARARSSGRRCRQSRRSLRVLTSSRPRESRSGSRKRGAVDVKRDSFQFGAGAAASSRAGASGGRADPGRRDRADWLQTRLRRGALAVAQPFVEPFDQALRGLGDHRPGREDRVDAGFAQRREILLRNDAADDDHRLAHPGLAERALQRRRQREMARRERRDADDMGLALRRQRRHFLGRGEQRPDPDVEAEVGEGRGDDLLAAVVSVLTHLGDQDARALAFVLGESAGHRHDPLVRLGGRPRLGEIDAGDGLDFRDMTAEGLFHGERDFADRRLGARGFDRQLQGDWPCRARPRSKPRAPPASLPRRARRAGASASRSASRARSRRRP